MASPEAKQRIFKSAVKADSQLAKQVEAFVEGGEKTYAFPAELSGAERAAVHKIARRNGLKAKSDGLEEDGTRRITLYRPSSEEERKRAVAAAEKHHDDTQKAKAERARKQEATETASGTGDDDPDDAGDSQPSDSERNPEMDTEYDSQEEDAVASMDSCDLHELLGVPKGQDGGTVGGPSRLRSAYHRQLLKWHPDTLRWTPSSGCPRVQAYRKAKRRFRQVCVAYAILMDEDRRRIYCDHGVTGLKKSEAYQEENVFELDPWEACERFFEAEDPDDREYFLLNGNAQLSDEDDDDDADEDEDEEEIARAAVAAAALRKQTNPSQKKESGEGLLGGFPMPPVGLGAASASAVIGATRRETDAARSVVGGDPWLSLTRKMTKQQQQMQEQDEKSGEAEGYDRSGDESDRSSPKDYKAKAYSVVDSPGTKLVTGSSLKGRLEAFKADLHHEDAAASSSDDDDADTDEEGSTEEGSSDEDEDEDGDEKSGRDLKDYQDKAYSILDSPGTAFVRGDGLQTVSLAELKRLREGPSVANVASDEDEEDIDRAMGSEDEEDEEEDYDGTRTTGASDLGESLARTKLTQ